MMEGGLRIRQSVRYTFWNLSITNKNTYPLFLSHRVKNTWTNQATLTPYKWSTNKTKEKQTRTGPKTISTRANAMANDTDDSADTPDSDEEEEDSVEVVGTGTVTRNTIGNLTSHAKGNQLQINTEDTINTLQESVAKLQAHNQMLARQIKNITRMGGVDKYELMQIRKMVKEDLFKRVKFITTTAMEAKYMKYLSNKLNVPPETQRE
jgi:hypothetical protein